MRTLAAVMLLAVSVQLPQRDAIPQGARTGAAAIRGRVFAPDGKTPVANATVTLSGTPQSPARPRRVTSDPNGRFELKDLPAGTYSINSGPSPYQKQYLYGSAQRITVADGQLVTDLALLLKAASVIFGRLVDEDGQPVGGVNVYASLGLDRTIGASQGSDELGRFRIFSLTPGSYVIVARPFAMADPNVESSVGLLETFIPAPPPVRKRWRSPFARGRSTTRGI